MGKATKSGFSKVQSLGKSANLSVNSLYTGGFKLQYIGIASDDSVQLVFSNAFSGVAHPRMMLVIGD